MPNLPVAESKKKKTPDLNRVKGIQWIASSNFSRGQRCVFGGGR